MRRDSAPCKDCEQRKPGCHDHCEGYQELARKKSEILEAYRAKINGEREANRRSYDQHWKILRRLK